ncbi:MAG: hypothetical protein ACUVTL_10970 [Thermoproteota archaeon]
MNQFDRRHLPTVLEALRQWISQISWLLSPPLVVVLGPYIDLAQFTPAWAGAVYYEIVIKVLVSLCSGKFLV